MTAPQRPNRSEEGDGVELWLLATVAFVVTVVLVLWRPGGIHEAIPALIGALIMFLFGLVDRHDVLQVIGIVWNAAMTIIATFIMAAVLDGAGFFRWAAARLTERAAGSGPRLFHLVLAFSICLTLFLNNDGSILLGTPVVAGLVGRLRLPRRTAFGYLIGACLMASAASAPVGVSNMANLEAMALLGMTVAEHTRYLFVPAVLGLGVCWALLYVVFSRDLPARLAGNDPLPPHPVLPHQPHPPKSHPPKPHPPKPHLPKPHPPKPHPPKPHGPALRHNPDLQGRQAAPAAPDFGFMWFAVAVVVIVRIGFFVASSLGIATYLVAMAGALVLVVGNLHRRVVDPSAALRRAPWPILAFAFGMDLVVFGLRNAGITAFFSSWLGPAVSTEPLAASFLPGLLVATLSSLLNNHPGLILGSLTLLEMPELGMLQLRLAYASTVLAADLGALFTPIGTLASLLWLHILQQQGFRYSWAEYLRVSLAVIPLSFVASLAVLYGTSLVVGR